MFCPLSKILRGENQAPLDVSILSLFAQSKSPGPDSFFTPTAVPTKTWESCMDEKHLLGKISLQLASVSEQMVDLITSPPAFSPKSALNLVHSLLSKAADLPHLHKSFLLNFLLI